MTRSHTATPALGSRSTPPPLRDPTRLPVGPTRGCRRAPRSRRPAWVHSGGGAIGRRSSQRASSDFCWLPPETVTMLWRGDDAWIESASIQLRADAISRSRRTRTAPREGRNRRGGDVLEQRQLGEDRVGAIRRHVGDAGPHCVADVVEAHDPPCRRIVPCRTGRAPKSISSTSDCPAPIGPAIPRTSPQCTVNVTSRTRSPRRPSTASASSRSPRPVAGCLGFASAPRGERPAIARRGAIR